MGVPARILLSGWITTLLFSSLPGAADLDLEQLAQELKSPTLPHADPIQVRDVEMKAGPATVRLEKGYLFPAAPIAGRISELVFLGEGRILLDPGNEIESGQLELFTDEEILDTEFDQAVLAIPWDSTLDTLLGTHERVGVGPEEATRSRELFDRWKSGPERDLLRVETAVFRATARDPTAGTYFAGWFLGSEVGDFIYSVKPGVMEQVTLEQVVYRRLSETERKKLRRSIHMGQRGRALARKVGPLWYRNTWLSYSLEDEQGNPMPGKAAFEPVRYELDVTISKWSRELIGKARLTLEAGSGGRKSLSLWMNPRLMVEKVTSGDGQDLFFFRSGWEIIVYLPQGPPAGEKLTLEVAYSGDLVEKSYLGVYWLTDTISWYPRAGLIDRAEYDVTFHWPRGRDLLASGKLVGEGNEGGGMRWERQVLEVPSSGFTFEMGEFQIYRKRIGHVDVTVAFDKTVKYLQKEYDEIVQVVIESLVFFEELFGPYPLDELKVVTTPRGFSQGMLGFVTLSVGGIFQKGRSYWYFSNEGRTIVAHELAHQWWGNLVGPQNYRDFWISEGIANYAALLYARARFGKERILHAGGSRGWKRKLNQTIRGGRTVESIGPIILGPRLSSTLNLEAYDTIVYAKGAVVLDMFSRIFPKGMFTRMLRSLVQYASHREISTSTFLAAMEKMSQTDLDWFAQQYIYGTGIPEVYYGFEFEPAGEGKWKVRGMARQHSPYRFQYRVSETLGGNLDVVRDRIGGMEIKDWNLVVPFQIRILQEDAGDGGEKHLRKKSAKKQKKEINTEAQGRLILTGENTSFTMDLENEPLDFWLDRKGTVLARFFCQSRHPKRNLFYQGLSFMAEGELEKAEELFNNALEADVFVYADPDRMPDEKIRKKEAEYLNQRIHLNLARLYLDQGEDDKAQKILNLFGRFLNKDSPRILRADFMVQQSRWEIHNRDYGTAFERLRVGMDSKGVSRGTEGYLLLAIAARATDHTEEFEMGLRIAKARGADVSLISEENH